MSVISKPYGTDEFHIFEETRRGSQSICGDAYYHSGDPYIEGEICQRCIAMQELPVFDSVEENEFVFDTDFYDKKETTDPMEDVFLYFEGHSLR